MYWYSDIQHVPWRDYPSVGTSRAIVGGVQMFSGELLWAKSTSALTSFQKSSDDDIK